MLVYLFFFSLTDRYYSAADDSKYFKRIHTRQCVCICRSSSMIWNANYVFVDLTHGYNKVHKSKDTIDSATNIFALNVEGSRSIETWWGVDGYEGDAITHFNLYNYTLIQLTDFKKYRKPNYFINWPSK